MTSNPTILTIILNYRTPELTLTACDAALREMEEVGGEVVVVENGSRDDSLSILRQESVKRGWDKSGRFRLLESAQNLGFGGGMNFGMAAGLTDGTDPDFYYLLNSDACPDPGAVAKLRDFLIGKRQAGLVGSGIRGIDNEPHRTAFRFPSIAGEFEGAARIGIISRLLCKSIIAMESPDIETQVDWTAGASMMIRRKVIEETGGFDEAFFLYFEETDLCRRALGRDWTTHYLPESGVVHVGSVSTGMKTWTRTPQYWFDSRLHYFTKTHGPLYAAGATGALIVGGILWRLRKILQRQPQIDPDWFLRDLTAHSLRTLFGRNRRDAGTSPKRIARAK